MPVNLNPRRQKLPSRRLLLYLSLLIVLIIILALLRIKFL